MEETQAHCGVERTNRDAIGDDGGFQACVVPHRELDVEGVAIGDGEFIAVDLQQRRSAANSPLCGRLEAFHGRA